jgi:hypothetical protein
MRRARTLLIWAICISLSLCAAYNVFSDNADVHALADATACGTQGPTCHPQMTRMERSPFAQTWDISTTKRTVTVRCSRAAILVGSYSCNLE